MFIEYSGYYVFVDLFFDDYIVWLQKSARYAIEMQDSHEVEINGTNPFFIRLAHLF